MARAAETRERITFRGESAFYTKHELREMRDLANVEDGEVWAAFVHQIKVRLGGEFLGRVNAS